MRTIVLMNSRVPLEALLLAISFGITKITLKLLNSTRTETAPAILANARAQADELAGVLKRYPQYLANLAGLSVEDADVELLTRIYGLRSIELFSERFNAT